MAIIVTVIGRLGKDAQVRNLPSGDTVTAFSLAGESGYGKKKQTMWFDCSFFGVDGERVAAYLSKGKAVLVIGEFSEREYNGNIYKDIRVSHVSFTPGGARSEDADAAIVSRAPTTTAQQPLEREAASETEREEDLPF